MCRAPDEKELVKESESGNRKKRKTELISENQVTKRNIPLTVQIFINITE